MPALNPNPTLADFQRYVAEMMDERGFNKETLVEEALLLGEEVGELYKAIRKASHIHTDATSKVGTIPEELADIFIYLCAIANMTGIDLEEAFRAKEEINKARKWA
ncbi:MAG: MazG nucleotide pyrophosphohydrolase domain-containing protein [Bdellovibrionales bacterium]